MIFCGVTSWLLRRYVCDVAGEFVKGSVTCKTSCLFCFLLDRDVVVDLLFDGGDSFFCFLTRARVHIFICKKKKFDRVFRAFLVVLCVPVRD